MLALLVMAAIMMSVDPAASQSSNNTVVNVTVKNIAFNVSTITVPAGANVTVNFGNQDTGVAHNIAFYYDAASEKPIYVGEIFNGPKTMVYTFTAPDKPGTYYFRCDVHPYNMKGQFIVK